MQVKSEVKSEDNLIGGNAWNGNYVYGFGIEWKKIFPLKRQYWGLDKTWNWSKFWVMLVIPRTD